MGLEQKGLEAEVYKRAGLSFQTPSLPFLSTSLIHPPTENAPDRSAGQEWSSLNDPHRKTRKAYWEEEDKRTAAKSLQSCPTLCDSIDGSPPGSPVPGILQARTLEWVAISFSTAWKWKMKVKIESEVAQSCPTLSDPMDCIVYQAPPSMGFSRQEYWSGLPLIKATDPWSLRKGREDSGWVSRLWNQNDLIQHLYPSLICGLTLGKLLSFAVSGAV